MDQKEKDNVNHIDQQHHRHHHFPTLSPPDLILRMLYPAFFLSYTPFTA